MLTIDTLGYLHIVKNFLVSAYLVVYPRQPSFMLLIVIDILYEVCSTGFWLVLRSLMILADYIVRNTRPSN